MTSFVLDTSALLTLHYNESGSDRVAEILAVNFEFKASATNGLLLTNQVEDQV